MLFIPRRSFFGRYFYCDIWDFSDDKLVSSFFFIAVWIPLAFSMDFTGFSCGDAFRQLVISHVESLKDRPALNDLKMYMESPAYRGKHSLEIEKNSARLVIEHLGRDQTRFNILTLRAIREGSLREIDAGIIVGPKAVILLDLFRKEAAHANVNLKVVGRWNAKFLEKQFFSQTANSAPNGGAYSWLEKDKEDFLRAFSQLKLDECNKILKVPASAFCDFRLVISGGQVKMEYFLP